MQSPEDSLFDIDIRPSNAELKFSLGFQLALFVGIGGVAPMFILHWAGVRQWALVGIPLLCATASVWWLLRFLKRRGIETKANYLAHGGNPAGTSDLLFGQVSYEITPDGRWKWPEQSYSGE